MYCIKIKILFFLHFIGFLLNLQARQFWIYDSDENMKLYKLNINCQLQSQVSIV